MAFVDVTVRVATALVTERPDESLSTQEKVVLDVAGTINLLAVAPARMRRLPGLGAL